MPFTQQAPDFSRLPDAELVPHIRAGASQAFMVLMRRHNRQLFRVVRSILRDDVEAEEALQEAYLQAYRKLDQFRGESALSTWLTRIAINEAYMRQRRSTRQAEIVQLGSDIDPAWEETARAEPAMSDAAGSPEQHAMRTEARRLLEAKIDALPQAFRTVFVLRAVEEMPVEEVAALLGMPEATVRTRYFRARSMLREALARELDIAFEGAFGFDGERCDRIVASVCSRLPTVQDEAQ
ncbi:RNA polymerase sigma-70 factor, ECF subfamily [Noviherbaspirillum humi]|uniref:RNA polymerase sigma-70 factor, ECF subfamily n=1 Tax=Noviherbaspirillum humi TaxID=1688639 RepID=A0A239IPS8_9BURK|nr:RNA polymerase sigma factor [Noviherbaspirillum humi]SNS95559.1 RNA polymerase sigma-70 factor, ECF subfamily [Noviherbaspirillum humi]